MPIAAQLGLGGHSFIQPLGNDPQPSFDEQCAIVATCLDHGIRLIDTTYAQERVALGNVLAHLGGRDAAVLMAWNFFRQPGREQELVPPTSFAPQHLDMVLDELQTDVIDVLVVHTHDDRAGLAQELDLAARWRDAGKVRQVALGMVARRHLEALPSSHPVTYALAPYNAFHGEAAAMFADARELGLITVALSPFSRGWKLDEIGEDKTVVAAHLLRWVAFQDLVDQVIVAMRKPAWVQANLDALKQGPLNPEEERRVQRWVTRAD